MLSVGKIQIKNYYNFGLSKNQKNDVSFGSGANLSPVQKSEFLNNLHKIVGKELETRFASAVELLPDLAKEVHTERRNANEFFRFVNADLKSHKGISLAESIGNVLDLAKHDYNRMFVKPKFEKHLSVLENNVAYGDFYKKLTQGLYSEKVELPSFEHVSSIHPSIKNSKKSAEFANAGSVTEPIKVNPIGRKTRARLERADLQSAKNGRAKLEIQRIGHDISSHENDLGKVNAELRRLKLVRAKKYPKLTELTKTINQVKKLLGIDKNSVLELVNVEHANSLKENGQAIPAIEKLLTQKTEAQAFLDTLNPRTQKTGRDVVMSELAVLEDQKLEMALSSKGLTELDSRISEFSQKQQILSDRISAANVRLEILGVKPVGSKHGKVPAKVTNAEPVNQTKALEKTVIAKPTKELSPKSALKVDSTAETGTVYSEENMDYKARKALKKEKVHPKKAKPRAVKVSKSQVNVVKAKAKEKPYVEYKMTPEQEAKHAMLEAKMLIILDKESLLIEQRNEGLFKLCGGHRDDYGLKAVERLVEKRARIDELIKGGDKTQEELGRVIRGEGAKPETPGIYDTLYTLTEQLASATGAKETSLTKQIARLEKQKDAIEAKNNRLTAKLDKTATDLGDLRTQADTLKYGGVWKSEEV